MKNELREWLRFLQAESHVLEERPGVLFQRAANQPDASSVAAAANRRWASGAERRPWLEWLNRPLQSDACLMTFVAHEWAGVTCCAYSPDGRRIVSGSKDRKLKVWNAQTGEEITTLRGHQQPVTACAYSPDGRTIASAAGERPWLSSSGSFDQPYALPERRPGELKVWDADTGEEIATLVGHEDCINHCTYSPDGRRIVSASDDCTLKLWDAAAGAEVATLIGHRGLVYSSAYSPNGGRILSRSADAIKVWDAETGEEAMTLVVGGDVRDGNSVGAAAYSPDGSRIWARVGETFKVWHAATGEEIATPAAAAPGYARDRFCGYSPDGKRAVSASGSELRVWDAETGVEIATLRGHREWVNACAFSPDGGRVVSASEDATLKVWDAEKAPAAQALRQGIGVEGTGGAARGDRPRDEGSPDGRRFAVVSSSDTLVVDEAMERTILSLRRLRWWGALCETLSRKLWSHSPACGRKLSEWSYIGSLAEARCLFSPDGQRLVSISGAAIRLRDARSGKVIRVVSGRAGSLGARPSGYTPDGRRFWCRRGTMLELWDAATWKPMGTVDIGHADAARSHAVSPDGRWIAYGSERANTLSVWAGATGGEVHALFLGDSVLAIEALPGGRCRVTGEPRGSKALGGFLHVKADLTRAPTYMLRVVGLDSGPPIVTAVYLYHRERRRWAEEPTAKCVWCEERLVVPASVRQAIGRIGSTSRRAQSWSALGSRIGRAILRIRESPLETLPAAAWNDPDLVAECPSCQQPLRFNPFLVDDRDAVG